MSNVSLAAHIKYVCNLCVPNIHGHGNSRESILEVVLVQLGLSVHHLLLQSHCGLRITC